MIRTPRLLLRSWRDDDLAAFASLNGDHEVMGHFPAALTREESDALAAKIGGSLEARGWGFWAVEVTGGPAFIGFCGVSVPSFEAHFTPAIEIGWRLARSAWGHGYATEAAGAAARFGFEHLGLDEIVAFTTERNVRSRRVMDRLGMTHDPSDDFDHPRVPPTHPLARHVLYRLARPE